MKITHETPIFFISLFLIVAIGLIASLFWENQNNNILHFESTQINKNFCLDNDVTFLEEHAIISQLLDSVYDIEYCHTIRRLPKNVDSVIIRRIKKRHLISEIERDTIWKYVTITPDSLIALDIGKSKNFILKYIDSISSEFNFVKNLKANLDSKKIKIDLIKQSDINFVSESSPHKQGLDPWLYAKKDSIFHVGTMRFSRVKYSAEYNVGMFHYTYLGDPNCGYTCYILFSKENSKWIYKQTIYTGNF